DQLADALARGGSVVGDDGEIALVLAYQFVDHALRGAHPHKAADHQARAIGDQGNRLIERESSHGRALRTVTVTFMHAPTSRRWFRLRTQKALSYCSTLTSPC